MLSLSGTLLLVSNMQENQEGKKIKNYTFSYEIFAMSIDEEFFYMHLTVLI